MPSPFPGMDPYLEGSMGVHSQFIAEIARQLAPQLRPRYLALMNERFVTEVPEGITVTTGVIYPDVGLTHAGADVTGGAGTAVATGPLRLVTVIPSRIPHFTVEIRDVANHQLVTVIEVLSPTNKRGKGREEYLSKRERILLSTTHLIEIDLLRKGQRLPMREPLPHAPYFVFVSREEARPVTEVWPVNFTQPLPRVPVPLLAGDPDAWLDLQQAYATVYDLIGYDLLVDYTKAPEVALPEAARDWADKLLRAAGKRP